VYCEGYAGSDLARITRETDEVSSGSAQGQGIESLVSTLWVCDGCDNRSRVYSKRSEPMSTLSAMRCLSCDTAMRTSRWQATVRQPLPSSGVSLERSVSAYSA
jgi:hypothetical protein